MPPGRAPWSARNTAATHDNAVPRVRETVCPPISRPTARMPYGPDGRSVRVHSAQPPAWTGRGLCETCGTGLRAGYFLPLASPSESEDSTAMKASCGTSTLPTIFIRFLPSFCFSSSFRLREMSPP